MSFSKKTHQNNTAYKILGFFDQKWQSYKAFLIYTNYDVIMTSYKPSILKIDSFLKSTHQNTSVCQILFFYLDKQQSYKAFHISYYDVIEALNLKVNAIFEESTSNTRSYQILSFYLKKQQG